MKEETIFVSDDGSRFESKEDALLWDQISHRVRLLKGEEEHLSDLPDGFRTVSGDTRQYLIDFLANRRDLDVFFAQDGLESRWLLERLKTFNYLTNYIFYGDANPCDGD